MRWLCVVSCLALGLACGMGEPTGQGGKARAERAGAEGKRAKGTKAGGSRKKDGPWNDDNPLRGLRFKGEFTHAGDSFQPKFCIAGTDPTSGKRMVALIYARLNELDEGGQMVAHSLDGNFPDSPGNTIFMDFSDPDSPEQVLFGEGACGSATVEDGGVVTDIERWNGSLSIDCPSIATTGKVRFEGCAVFSSEPTSAAAAAGSSFSSFERAYRSGLRRGR